jgi:hypothetical protein
VISGWQSGGLAALITISQILTAGIAIMAFSLLLYALTFNLREGVVRSFALILGCIVIAFAAEAIGSTAVETWQIEFWLRFQWVGIILLPAAYFQFSGALLATTGKPSRLRKWMLAGIYLASLAFLVFLALSWFVGPLITSGPPAPHLQPTLLTDVFVVYYLLVMGAAAVNFWRAYRRTVTPTSRRRMGYLLIGATAPPIGSFPFLLFGSDFAALHPLIFWWLAVLTNLLLGAMIIIMAYAVAFFDAFWSDRVVKARLLKWIMRGPVTASLVLALVTIVRRLGETFGVSYSALVPIIMVATILLAEHFISTFAPVAERALFWDGDTQDLQMLRLLEGRLLTRNDLQQFLEMILAAVCDRLQAPGAYIAAFNNGGLERVVTIGQTRFRQEPDSTLLESIGEEEAVLQGTFRWGDDLLIPLQHTTDSGSTNLLGLLGISGAAGLVMEDEPHRQLSLLVHRAALALRDRRMQTQIFNSLEELAPQVEFIQRLRAAGRYDRSDILSNENLPYSPDDLSLWVRDALTHYWGGPRLTESPLLQLQLVQNALDAHDGNPTNALRSILREAIDRVRPEGDRRFTGEWILYNILEMKFLEGKKVREIAARLAMSEADLYRKQRVAIEVVAQAILEMESQARRDNGEGQGKTSG